MPSRAIYPKKRSTSARAQRLNRAPQVQSRCRLWARLWLGRGGIQVRALAHICGGSHLFPAAVAGSCAQSLRLGARTQGFVRPGNRRGSAWAFFLGFLDLLLGQARVALGLRLWPERSSVWGRALLFARAGLGLARLPGLWNFPGPRFLLLLLPFSLLLLAQRRHNIEAKAQKGAKRDS